MMQCLSARVLSRAGYAVHVSLHSPSSVRVLSPTTCSGMARLSTACMTATRTSSRASLLSRGTVRLGPRDGHGRPSSAPRCFSLTMPRQSSPDGDQGSRKQPAASPPKPAQAKENIYTIPNMLTASRLVASPFIGYCIVHDHHAAALALLAWAGISDLLDGWIARRWDLGTVVGTIIDPMADKTLMLVLTVSLAVKGALPLWLVAIIIGRDVGLALSAIYYRWVSLPPPKTFMRYWDFSLPSAEVRPTTISKYNTFLQLALMGVTTTAPVVPFDLTGPLTYMQYLVALTTVWSGASYVFSKDAVKILSQAKTVEKTKRL